MALGKGKTKKLYYSIGEVAKMLREPESTIKYWEREFPHISPQRSAGGTRQYTERNIEALRVIKKLLRERGLTVEGAKSELSQRKTSYERREQALTRLRSALDKLNALQWMLSSK